MSALRVLFLLSIPLAAVVCAPQHPDQDDSFGKDFSDPKDARADSDGDGSGGGSSRRGGGSRPFFSPSRFGDSGSNARRPFLSPSRPFLSPTRGDHSLVDLKPVVLPSRKGDGGLLSLLTPSRGGSRPRFPINGPAGSPEAAVNLAGNAAHSAFGASGGTKGVGIRVFQSKNDRVSVGAGFSSNLKGANSGGLHVAIKVD